MFITGTTIRTLKEAGFYVAYAPDLDLSAFGDCQDEAVNNLTDEIGQQRFASERITQEKK